MTVTLGSADVLASPAPAEASSPFGSAPEAGDMSTGSGESGATGLASPFEAPRSEVREQGVDELVSQFAGELASEDFTDSVQALIDAGARQHMAQLTTWATAPT